MNPWTDEQIAFQRIHRRCTAAVQDRYPGSMDFRLVRLNGHAVGWTFHTGNYPKCNFGWVTVRATIGEPKYELRIHARRNLKENGETK